MDSARVDPDALAMVICIGLPIALGVAFGILGQWLRHKQLALMMDERRLLIEKGVTDLPRLELPRQSARRMDLFDLRAGIIFLSVGIGLLLHRCLAASPPEGQSVETGFIAVLGALGLGLIAFHFIARAYARQDLPPAPVDPARAPGDAEEERSKL